MKRRLLVAVLPVVVLVVLLAGTGDATSAGSGALGTRGSPWTGSPGVTESVASLATRQRAENRKRAGQPLGIREKPEPGEEAPSSHAKGEVAEEEGSGEEPSGPKLRTIAAPDLRTGRLAVTPKSSFSTGTSFDGANVSESGFIPPDSMGSVGPDQVLVFVNGRIKVYDKQGVLGDLNVSDSTFWSSVSNGFEPTDPGVEYDRLSGRWIVSAVNTVGSNNRVMLAVSDGSTITDSTSFTFFQFSENVPPPAGDTGLFADYPQLGVDKHAVYIGVNDFSGDTFAHTTAFVIRKSSVLGAGPIVVTAFRNLTSGALGQGPDSPQPAQDMDPNVEQGYIVGPDNQLANRIDVRRITFDLSEVPTMSGNLMITVPATAQPLNVPALGTHNTLDALDDRLYEAMVGRAPDGTLSLWTAHNIAVNSSGVGTASGDRDGARWYQLGTLDATPTLTQSGTLFDSAALSPRFFWMPSIAMNGQGNASLNTSVAGTTEHAEIAASGHLATDATGATEPPDITQTSSKSYNLGSGSNKRWGDYSQTVVDPSDNMTFWTFQEYTNANNSWAVRVIKMRPPPPATPTSASPTPIDPEVSSQSVVITGTSVDGSGFFDPGSDPGGPGYTSQIDATVSGGVTVNSVTYTDPTHVTLDLDTTGTPEGSKNVTITNPDGQSATGSNILVVGSDVTPPDPPSLQGTIPASPANNNGPTIFGSAEGGSTVNIFADDSTCTDPPVATGTASTFASPGIGVSVLNNTTTTFYATATDISNNTSDCSSTLVSDGSVTYVEDSTIPPNPPSLLGTVPTSPANNNAPLILGSADPGSMVSLYANDPTCTAGPVATDSADNFASPGIPVSVANNSTTTFYATATDGVNTSNCSSTLGSGGSKTYVEDSTPPAVSVSSGPTGTTSDQMPTFTFSATDALAITFQCSIDVGTPSFRACSGPGNSDTPASPLANGSHVFRVRAIDAVGNSAVATRSFSVDTSKPASPVAPETTITKGPKKKTTKRRPKFKFTSDQAGATFQCKLDRGHFDACTSPYRPPLKLRPGKHVLRVQAVGPTGLVDPAPAVRKFKVLPSA